MLAYLDGAEIAVIAALIVIPLAAFGSIELVMRNKRRREMRLATRNKAPDRGRR